MKRSRQIEPSKALASLRSNDDDRFRAIFDAVNDGIFISDPDTGRMIDINQPACRMFGYPKAELIGRNVNSLSSGVHPHNEAVALELNEKARLGEPQVVEWQNKKKDGTMFWTEISLRYGEFEHRPVMVAVMRDITERKKVDAQIMYAAQHDVLTGLLNRTTFAKALDLAIARAGRTGKKCAVLCLDLDHFKDINDTRGHLVGDRILQLVAKRLKGSSRVFEVVARFGGDEFAILLEDVGAPSEVSALADRLIASISMPFSIDGNDLHVGVSIGVAIYGEEARTAEALLSQGDIALYRAKDEGQRSCQFFTRAMNEEVRSRVRLTDELRVAIAAGQLFLVYQPQVKANDGRIVGAEALVRWQHPRRGILSPAEFLAVAEGSGLIGPLGEWVLREACRQGRSWIDAGLEFGTIAVNLSTAQFKTPLELERSVFAALADTGFAPSMLELEITETVLINLTPQHEEVIRRLRSAGVRFSLDDFGTGYSSLNYLRRFSVDRIKIAREFVADLTTSREAAAIVKLVLGLSHDCASEVIAEGVETPEQLRLLMEWGCSEVQGFYFAAPMRAEAISPLLRAGTITPPTARSATVAA